MEKGLHIMGLIVLCICLLISSYVLYVVGCKDGCVGFVIGDKILIGEIPDCEDGDICTNNTYSLENRTCVSELIEHCEGNSICELDEYGISTDCPDCDDNYVCTVDSYNYTNLSCANIAIVPCAGNGVCENGEYNSSADCPDCADNDKCTLDYYDFNKKECLNMEVSGACCGNGRCEYGEDYLNCNKDCDPSLALGNLTTDQEYEEYYSFTGDFVRVNGSALEENDVVGSLGDYEDFKVHVLIFSQVIKFQDGAYGFDVKMECEDQEGAKIEANGNYGWAVLLKDDNPYIVIDDTYLSCVGSYNCTGQQVDNMVGIKQGYSGGEAKFNFQFLVNPEYNFDLTCDIVISVDDPKQDLEFDIEVSYTKPE